MNPSFVIRGVRDCAQEKAVERFAPVVIQTAEIALYAVHVQLNKCLANAKEQEVEVQDCIVDALSLDCRETQSRDGDESESSRHEHDE